MDAQKEAEYKELLEGYRETGIDKGYGAAECNKSEVRDAIYKESIEDIDEVEDKFREYASEGECNSRQYSPFEFFAKELNDLDSEYEEGCSEEAWEAYDEGVSEGIDKAWKESKEEFQELLDEIEAENQEPEEELEDEDNNIDGDIPGTGDEE